MTTVKIIESTTNNLYYYAGQCNPQPAHIYLDCRNGEMHSDYSGEIGSAVPMTVWHNLILRWRIDPWLTVDAINDLMESIKDDCQKIIDGFEEIFDGSNYVGSFTEEAYDINESMQRRLDDLCANADKFGEYTWAEWMGSNDIWAEICESESLEEVEETLREDLSNEDEIRDDFIEYLAELIEYFNNSDLETAKKVPAFVWKNEQLASALRESVLDDDVIDAILHSALTQ